MGKLKTGALLLLTLALIAAGAFLPKIVLAVQDSRVTKDPAYHQIPAIQLQIQEPIRPQCRLAMMDKLDGVVEIPEEKASMTQAEAIEAASAALKPYMEAGLIVPFQQGSVVARPLLAHVPENPDLMGIFWTVTFTEDSELFYFLVAAIDDETGELLQINYTISKPLEQADWQYILQAFSYLYFTALDIPDYAEFATRDLEESFIGDTQAIRYRFGDIAFGEINVDLLVHEYGFYTEFPDL